MLAPDTTGRRPTVKRQPAQTGYKKITFTPPDSGGGGLLDTSSLLSALTTPIDTKGLTADAHRQALQDTGAVVGAIRGQQAEIQAAAAQRARDIGAASLGAAKYLSGLNIGHGLSDSMRQSAGDQASLASGFSGQLQQDVGDQGAKVQAALSAIGAPGGVPSTAAKAGNTVYGLGGLLPANAMLQAAPFVEAQAKEAPASLLGYGQQEGAGALGAGRAQAATLDPQIASTEAKLPSVEQGYLSKLQSAAEKNRQDQIGNVFKTLTLQQKGADSDATRQWRQAQLDAKAADLAATTAYRQAEIDAKTETAKALAAYRQGQLDISNFNATTSRINAKLNEVKLTLPDADLSAKRGILVDSAGNPKLGSDGKPIYLPGFAPGPNGTVAKVAPPSSTTGKFSNSDVATLAHDISGWKSGITGTANGAPVVDPNSQLNWGQAYTRALGRLPATAAGKAKALQLVNAEYGTPISIATRTVAADKTSGLGLTDSLKGLLTAAANGNLPVPLKYAIEATARVYGAKPADVQTILTQLQQLVTSGQVKIGG